MMPKRVQPSSRPPVQANEACENPSAAEGQAEPRAKTPKRESDAAGLFQLESRCEARIIYCGISFRAQTQCLC